jgi:hypothetical protein
MLSPIPRTCLLLALVAGFFRLFFFWLVSLGGRISRATFDVCRRGLCSFFVVGSFSVFFIFQGRLFFALLLPHHWVFVTFPRTRTGVPVLAASPGRGSAADQGPR